MFFLIDNKMAREGDQRLIFLTWVLLYDSISSVEDMEKGRLQKWPFFKEDWVIVWQHSKYKYGIPKKKKKR